MMPPTISTPMPHITTANHIEAKGSLDIIHKRFLPTYNDDLHLKVEMWVIQPGGANES